MFVAINHVFLYKEIIFVDNSTLRSYIYLLINNLMDF